MSVDDYQPIPAGLVLSAKQAAEPGLDEVGTLGDEFAQLSDTLRQRARQVGALIERANAAEERCTALVYRQADQDRVIADLRDQLSQVNARVAEFQEPGARHLAELQAVTEEYARRVAASGQASKTLRGRVAELTDLVEQRDNTIAATQSLFAAQDERLAQYRQRMESAAAIEARLVEYVEATNRHLHELMALNEETERPRDHNPVPLHAGWAAASRETPVTLHDAPVAVHPAPTQVATVPADDTAKEPAQARGWYRRARQSVG